MFESIYFDLDGTLLDTIHDLAMAGNHTRAQLGLTSLPVEQYKQMVGNGIPRLVQRMIPSELYTEAIAQRALSIFSAYYAAHYNDLTSPYPGINQLLAVLKDRNVKLAVISNKQDNFTQALVAQHFPGVFDLVLGQTTAFLPKPDPDILQYSMRILHSSKNMSLYCGDSNIDIRTAHNADLPCCGVSWGFREKDELLQNGVDYLIEEPFEMLDIVFASSPLSFI